MLRRIFGRTRVTSLGAAAAVASLVALALPPAAAHADITSNFLVSSTINTSDPFTMPCSDSAFAWSGTCLYTSSDMGTTGLPAGSYPMHQTLLFTLTNGWDPSVTSNWIYRGPIFDESQITVGVTDQYGNPTGFVPPGANHLWAPTVAQGGDGNFYLFVPDVSDNSPAGVHTSSRIAVAVSTSAFGPFQYLQTLGIAGYASDPDVFQTMEPATYVAYADGDFSTCGGVSIAYLDGYHMQAVLSSSLQIQVNGWPSWGTCTASDGTYYSNRPYMEGPQIYWTASWGTGLPGPYLLMVAAKPNNVVPTECQGFGQPNKPNEVLAYATSNSPYGPYTYQGVLMCGSSTEWTNQGSLMPMYDDTGKQRIVLVYHDGPTGANNRKVHAECVYYGANHFSMVSRTANGFSTCMRNAGGVDDNYVALRNQSTGLFVSAENAGSSPLVANRYAVGAWELFNVHPVSSNVVTIQAQVNSKWIRCDSPNYQLIANLSSNTQQTDSRFTTAAAWDGVSSNAFTSANGNRPISTGTNNVLQAKSPGSGLTYFDILHL
jgi:hypothetical protein